MAATRAGMGAVPNRPPRMSEPRATWLTRLRQMMRSDLLEAERHSAAWEARKDRIRSVYGEDVAALRTASKTDIVLADEMDAWSFFERRAKLYAAVITAEMAIDAADTLP